MVDYKYKYQKYKAKYEDLVKHENKALYALGGGNRRNDFVKKETARLKEEKSGWDAKKRRDHIAQLWNALPEDSPEKKPLKKKPKETKSEGKKSAKDPKCINQNHCDWVKELKESIKEEIINELNSGQFYLYEEQPAKQALEEPGAVEEPGADEELVTDDDEPGEDEEPGADDDDEPGADEEEVGLDSKDSEDAKIIAEEEERIAEEEERIGEEVKIENEELIAKEEEKEEEKEGKGFLDFMFGEKAEQEELEEIATLNMVLKNPHKLKERVITFMTNNLPYLRAEKLGFDHYRRLDDIKKEQLEKLIENSSKINEWLESKDIGGVRKINPIKEEIETVADSYFDISGRNGTLDSLRAIIKLAKEERERKDKE